MRQPSLYPSTNPKPQQKRYAHRLNAFQNLFLDFQVLSSFDLDSRVILNNRVLGSVSVPVGTSAVDGSDIHECGHLRLTFEELKSETFRCVPRDVAVHEPCL